MSVAFSPGLECRAEQYNTYTGDENSQWKADIQQGEHSKQLKVSEQAFNDWK